MPRGVYDRSKMKAKRAAEAAAAGTAPAAEKKSYKKVGRPAGVRAAPVTAISSNPIQELYQHLEVLRLTRVGLSQPSMEHNPNVLQSIDGEITATVTSLKNWRESRFPTSNGKHEALGQGSQQKEKTSISTPAPAPVQPGVGVPPLPFTPAAVQEVMKSGGTQ